MAGLLHGLVVKQPILGILANFKFIKMKVRD